MKNNNFFLSGLLIILLVSFATSLLTSYIFQKTVLRGPSQEGIVDISGGIPTIVDVIIIDNSVLTGITDTVAFSGVTLGSTHITSVAVTTTSPRPFVIRNNGNVNSKVEINQRRSATQTNLGLFDDANSRLKYWVADSTPIIGVAGYSSLDNCATASPSASCRVTGSLTPCAVQPNANDATCTIPVFASGSATAATIYYQEAYDEIYLHILIYVSPTESAGTKSTIVTLVGTVA